MNFLWKLSILGILGATLLACGPSRLSRNGENAITDQDKKPEDCSNPPCQAKEPGNPKVDPPPAPSPTPGEPEGSEKVALGFFGGYTSCETTSNGAPDPRLASFQEIFEEVENAVSESDLAFQVKTCFTLDPTRISYRIGGTAQVTTAGIADVIRSMVTELSKHRASRIHLVGHSYGGWTAMHIAKSLPENITIASLTTIDPISVRQCTPDEFLFSGGNSPACKSAPGDFSESEISAIKQRSASWNNFYQKDSTALHSGPISKANNIQKTYSSPGFEPHSDFLTDSSVIQTIVDGIKGP